MALAVRTNFAANLIVALSFSPELELIGERTVLRHGGRVWFRGPAKFTEAELRLGKRVRILKILMMPVLEPKYRK